MKTYDGLTDREKDEEAEYQLVSIIKGVYPDDEKSVNSERDDYRSAEEALASRLND